MRMYVHTYTYTYIYTYIDTVCIICACMYLIFSLNPKAQALKPKNFVTKS